MRFAERDGQRVLPKKGETANCPVCGDPVRAKCGTVKVHHWAHVNREADCDPWYEPMTEWHLNWQNAGWRTEVVVGNHRADIVTRDRRVVEVQHSSISVDQVRERMDFYNPPGPFKRMLWVFDVRKQWGGRRRTLYEVSAVRPRSSRSDRADPPAVLRWKGHPNMAVLEAAGKSLPELGRRGPLGCVYLDVGEDRVFQVWCHERRVSWDHSKHGSSKSNRTYLFGQWILRDGFEHWLGGGPNRIVE